MDNEELNGAITWLVHNENLRLPHNANPAHPNQDEHPGLQPAADALAWDTYIWNPPFVLSRYIEFGGQRRLFSVDPDPDASPKPTWADLNRALAHYKRVNLTQEANYIFSRHPDDGPDFGPNPAYERARLSDDATVHYQGNDVHVHGGLDRMSALLQMVENANESGHPLPFIRMRNDRNTAIDIHTQGEIRDLLGKLAHRKNQVESAHNAVMEQYQEFARVRDDEFASPGIRLNAAENAVKFLETYNDRLQVQMDNYDQHALPSDFEKLKDTYIERIEARALNRQRYLRGVITEQGQKLSPSCSEEATAAEAVARAERIAAIEIASATDAAEAKAEFDAGVTAIDAIEPLNVPDIYIDGTKVTVPSGGVIERTGSTFTIEARHPRAGLQDRVMLRVFYSTGSGALTVRRLESTSRISVTPAGDPGDVVDVAIRSRSLCGPRDATLRITIPQPA